MVKKLITFIIAIFTMSLVFGQYIVDFEGTTETKGAYASGTVSLSGLNWDMTESLIGNLAADFKNGTKSARMRGYAASSMTMLADKTGGLGTVSFQYRRYGTDPQVDWMVQYSTNQGISWAQIGSSFTAPTTDVVQTFTADVNVTGDVRIRIKRATETGATNSRLNIDDITLTDNASLALISLTGTLTPFTTTEGTPSDTQSYTLTGSNLTSDIAISVPSGFEISSDSGANYVTTASLSSTFDGTILVRMTGAASGVFGGDIIHSSTGAQSVNLSAVGTVSSAIVNASGLFFSEYLEGSANNKSIEIFNGTGADVNLADYKVELYSNGSSTVSTTLNLTGTLVDGDVYVIAYSLSNSTILALADVTSGVVNFNGDDALGLIKISTSSYVDIFGKIGNDPGTAWTGDGGYTTLDRTLVRKSTVSGGITSNPEGTGVTAFTTLTTDWDMYPIDTTTYLGSHTFEGSGGTVLAPTTQASGIVTYPTSASIALEWTPGNGSRRIVKINTSNSFTSPTDGTSPAANTFWAGSGEQVIYNGTTQIVENLPYNGCEVTNLSSSSTYWFRIYEFNGTGSNTKFLTTTATDNPKSAVTLTAQGTGYYAGITGYGSTIKANLHTLIKNTHTTQYSYTALITQIPYTDEDPANPNNLIEIYTGWSVPKGDFGAGVTDWNREHTWSKSHGNFGDVAPAGTDLHHLRPCDATVNSRKSNRDFDDGGTLYTDNSPPAGYTGDTGCYDTTNSWEPRPADKGDVARMVMYMAVRYEGDDTSYDLELVDYTYSDAGTYEPFYGKLSTLLNWSAQDPPDARERQRNERIYERQGNRNPFIDMPSYAQYIWTPVPTSNTSISTSSFTGNWSTPLSATKYYLQVASDSLFTNFVSGYSDLDVALTTSRNITGLSIGGTYYYRLRSYFLSGYSMYSPYMAVTPSQPAIPTAALTPSGTLEEIILNGSVLTFTMTNTTFTDGALLAANFVLNNAPVGLTIQSVSNINTTTASITLAFTGTDFDTNYTAFTVTVLDAEIAATSNLTSSALTIKAHVEGSATIALVGDFVRLTITPVSGAAIYHVFASAEPYGDYLEISLQGDFDPLNINIWSIDTALADKRFFCVSAVRN